MNVLSQTEDQLKQAIADAVLKAELATAAEMPDIILEKPKDKQHGDFAANIAMQLARIAKKAPRQIAEDIVNTLDKSKASVDEIEIAGPGFINFFMKEDYLGDLVKLILDEKADYGKTGAGNGQRIQVEFVSVNPTGDLHLGHARGAAFGDVLCNVLAAAGYDVDREYYINDAGSQIDNLAKSVDARYFQELGEDREMPEDGYHGEDVIGIAKALVMEYKESWTEKSEEERLDFFKEYGLKYELNKLRVDLDRFGVFFDNWFSERSLYKDGKIDDALRKLAEGEYTYQKEGALWFRSTDFGDDKDRVLIKNDGNYTYLTPDIAYHKDKLDRGYDKIINVWGADHHGYIPRMRAAIQALGYPADKMDVKIIQMVNLFEGGEKMKMSKRAGKLVALRDLVDEVGVDAVRYYFLTRSNDSQLDFDVELARSQSNDNPVFYVQYAHARICTMLKQAESKGFNVDGDFDASLLTSEKELDLLKQLGAFPQAVADAAEKFAPHKMTQYVFELASALHSFYNAEKVLDPENKELTQSRIALMRAVRITLQNSLKLLGVKAPEQM
ncbi:arginine--tRNA ligase [Aciduricibacillus chroicocephali]|uniref:Arginine--tRNA ligase n=1 Tax=Aciduricibacillus chroicocephali TaxID=3054939 RepID=A0ABY9KU17_9BACI|nr:arginine--tRNA ligase [Bacillaceae bacterium 44XB]